MDTVDYATEAVLFDYRTEAELFSARGRKARRQPLGYRRFARAADAIRFAIEELPPQLLAGTYLEVDEERFEATKFVVCTRAPTIPLLDAPRARSHDHSHAQQVRRLQSDLSCSRD